MPLRRFPRWFYHRFFHHLQEESVQVEIDGQMKNVHSLKFMGIRDRGRVSREWHELNCAWKNCALKPVYTIHGQYYEGAPVYDWPYYNSEGGDVIFQIACKPEHSRLLGFLRLRDCGRGFKLERWYTAAKEFKSKDEIASMKARLNELLPGKLLFDTKHELKHLIVRYRTNEEGKIVEGTLRP